MAGLHVQQQALFGMSAEAALRTLRKVAQLTSAYGATDASSLDCMALNALCPTVTSALHGFAGMLYWHRQRLDIQTGLVMMLDESKY